MTMSIAISMTLLKSISITFTSS